MKTPRRTLRVIPGGRLANGPLIQDPHGLIQDPHGSFPPGPGNPPAWQQAPVRLGAQAPAAAPGTAPVVSTGAKVGIAAVVVGITAIAVWLATRKPARRRRR
jgi:hypothetical protein